MQEERLTPQQSIPRIKQYCAYRERCHSEVQDKLYSFGLNNAEVQEITSRMVEEDFLNEERFAIAFAGGKFRVKGWGRVKIRYELKQRRVSDYCIKKALAEIDEDRYAERLEKYAEEKLRSVQTEKNLFTRKKKLFDYLRAKGYEADLVNDVLKRLLS